MIVTKTIVGVATVATFGIVMLTGSVALAEGLTIETPYALAVLAGSGTVIAFLFRALIVSKDREFASLMREKEADNLELKERNKSFQELAVESAKFANDLANFYRLKEGKGPIAVVAPVVPESHSPPNEKQREAAVIQTLRAKMAAIKVAMDFEPREEQK